MKEGLFCVYYLSITQVFSGAFTEGKERSTKAFLGMQIYEDSISHYALNAYMTIPLSITCLLSTKIHINFVYNAHCLFTIIMVQ